MTGARAARQERHNLIARGWVARGHCSLGVLGLMLWAGMPCGALAQTDANRPSESPTATADAAAVLAKGRAQLKEYTVHAIARLGVLDLRLRPDPTPEDYRIAALAMGIADSMQPGDAETLRRIAEASWNGTDEQAAIDATAKLVQADPTDRVSILRVISATIARMQTAEDRLAAYDKLLGAGGARLPSVVRSRLALDCAMLLRERGDDEGFLDRMKLATSLDATNKEAALLASAFYNQRSSDPMGRLEMLANLLYSDPMDPGVHEQISTSLAQSGSFIGARRMWTNAQALLNQSGPEKGFDAESRRLVHDWLCGSPSDTVLALNKRLATEREGKAKQLEQQAKTSGAGLSEVGKVEDQRLPVPLDRVRVLAAIASGDRITYETGCVDMARTGASLLKEANDPQIELLMPRDDALDFAKRAMVTAELIAAVAGVSSQELTDNLATLEQLGVTDDPRLNVAKIARGVESRGVDASLADLMILSFSADPSGEAEAAASVIAADALKKQSKREQAATLLRACARKHILIPMGALAWSRFQQIKGPDERLSSQAATLDAFAESIPRWIDQAINDPRSMMALDAQLEKSTIGALQRPVVKVRLRNVAPIPLSLGPDRTINSRLIFSPRMDVGINSVGQLAQPEIVEADRRLRLEPNETLEFDVWPDIGFTGWLSESMCSDLVRVRWRVLQGFRSSEQGVIEPGPGCLSTETGTLVRSPLAESALEPAEIPSRVLTRDESELLPIAVILRARVMSLSSLSPNDAERPKIIGSTIDVIKAFAERYPTLSPLGRAMLLCTMPHKAQLPEMEVFDKITLQELDPQLLTLALLTRCDNADEPVLNTATESANPTLHEVARLHKSRLADGQMCFARLTGDLGAFNPPIENAP